MRGKSWRIRRKRKNKRRIKKNPMTPSERRKVREIEKTYDVNPIYAQRVLDGRYKSSLKSL